MQTLPQPLLGEVNAITITTPDLEKSLAFYQQLGFAEVMRMDFPFPWIQVTDGALLIMLRKDNTAYLALTYYVSDVDTVVAKLEADGIVFAEKPKPSDAIRKFLIRTPDNTNISLVQIMGGYQQPAGPTMLKMPPQDYMKPEKYVNKTCGMFGELAQPVKDLDASIAYWEKLGFVVLSKMNHGYPWAIVSDGLAVVGLHQTTHFDKAIITYFAADMQEKIAALKEKGVNIAKESGPANITVQTPEGQLINLFKLGM